MDYFIGAALLLMGLSVSPILFNIGFWIPFVIFTLSAMVMLFICTIISIFVITMIQKRDSK